MLSDPLTMTASPGGRGADRLDEVGGGGRMAATCASAGSASTRFFISGRPRKTRSTRFASIASASRGAARARLAQFLHVAEDGDAAARRPTPGCRALASAARMEAGLAL